MAVHARSASERGIAREAAGDVAVDVAADVAADLAANVVAQLPWIGDTPRVRERVVEGAGERTVALPLSREASARLARELGLGLGSGRGRGSQNGFDLRRDGNPPFFSPGTADGPRRIPRLRAQTSARVALASLTIFASLATSLLHELANRGSLPASVRSGGARESLQSRGGAPRGAGAMNRKQVLAAVIGVGAVTTGAAAQNAVQWRVEDGGNGHWYRMELSPMGWSVARTAALAKGGDLASFESDAEFSWVRTTISGHPWPSEGCHLGGVQTPSSPSPDAGWSWLTGGQVSLQVTLDFDDNPCGQGCCGENNEQNFLHSYENWQKLGDANEVTFAAGCPASFTAYASLIEWSADCNADGVVDYGQILSGELEDTNSNGVPDCCDAGTSCDCPADIDGNGDINGIDLAIILDKWGTNGGKDYPNADIDGDGTIAGADLAQVLGNWGACQ